MTYYDMLQDIIDVAKRLQGLNISENEEQRIRQLVCIEHAQDNINQALTIMQPEVWVGDPKDNWMGLPIAPGMKIQ